MAFWFTVSGIALRAAAGVVATAAACTERAAPMYPPDFDLPPPPPPPPRVYFPFDPTPPSAAGPRHRRRKKKKNYREGSATQNLRPCPPCLFAREKVPSVIVSYRPRSDDRYVGAPSALRSYSPKRLELRFVYQLSINPSLSVIHVNQSRHILAIIVRLVNRSRKISFSPPRPVTSRQSGMVQPVIQEMYATTVHAAAGSSLFGLFSSSSVHVFMCSCSTFDSTPVSEPVLASALPPLVARRKEAKTKRQEES
eukprot:scaffold8378_cov113-Isochrysis_galbana.AAC.7